MQNTVQRSKDWSEWFKMLERMGGVGGNGIDYFHIRVLGLCFLSKYLRLGLMFWLHSAAFLNADVSQI